jgi:hypothetical protein
MAPEPVRVRPSPAPAAPAGDHLADPAGSHRPPAAHTGPQLRPMTPGAPRADADAPAQAAGGRVADLDDPGRAALTADGDPPAATGRCRSAAHHLGGTGCRPVPATADTPKATEPIRLSSVIHQDHDRGPPAGPAVADLEPGQRAGHQEADRAHRVRPPHMLVRRLRGQVFPQRVPGAEVEEQGSGQLHRGRPPVDPAGLEDEEAPPGACSGCGPAPGARASGGRATGSAAQVKGMISRFLVIFRQ